MEPSSKSNCTASNPTLYIVFVQGILHLHGRNLTGLDILQPVDIVNKYIIYEVDTDKIPSLLRQYPLKL